jgi:DNA polymerase III subunit gamma/tau
MSKDKGALAVKYRPTKFEEVIGQDGLVAELKGLIKTEAYRYTNSLIISGSSGGGKAQPLKSKVLTPYKGFVELGSVKEGDLIYGELGDIHKVEGVYPQGLKHTYTIYFDDNTTVKCSADHLWEYHTKYPLRRKVDTLRAIKKLLKTEDIYIRANAPLNMGDEKFKVDKKLLRKINKKKGIAKKYLSRSKESRLELARLLFKQGGEVSSNRLIFNDKYLCKDYIYLMRTLGYVAKELTPTSVEIIMKAGQPAIYKDFKIANSYKQDLVDRFIGTKIVKIERSKKSEMVCIKTSNPTSLYITDSFKVTHNTTIARIFAKAINCKAVKVNKKPCNKCEYCVAIDKNNYADYLELDATSYRGVKEVEPLKVLAGQFPATKGGVRIIYLDEAHTLSNQAWDVLLKLLEEGRNSTIFFFATTQLHSIRPAIVNRSQVFKVRPISRNETVLELQRIATLEGIKVSREVLENIARVYTKGLRDAISGLDKLYKTKGSDLSNVKLDKIESEEDQLLKVFLEVKTKGLTKAIISLELLEIDPKEFKRISTNILLALYISEEEGNEESILDLGVKPNLLKKVKVMFKDIKKLISMTANYTFNTRDQVKLYLLLLDNMIKSEIVEEVKMKEEVRSNKPKRRGLKVKPKEKTKEPKKKKKSKLNKKQFKEI